MDDIQISDVNTLIESIKNGYQPIYLFFWGHRTPKDGQIGKQCLSQWWPSPFQVDHIHYPTAEHFLMAEKARLFGDEELRAKIIAAKTPGEAKILGRVVKNFDEDLWLRHRDDLALHCNEAKFSQNEGIKTYLLGTKQKVLVEASPVDGIWGIGLDESDPRATFPEEWRGLNLLGFTLMKVRSKLQKELNEIV
jgi:ribA/ribD-fused uncharacterized protein